MPIPSLGDSENGEVLRALNQSTASSVVPLFLLESFIIGVLCAGVPLASYLIWIKLRPSRVAFLSILWIFLMAMVVHWALSWWQLVSLITGRFLGISVAYISFGIAVVDQPNSEVVALVPGVYYGDPSSLPAIFYGEVWGHLLPLVTETVLFGYASSVYAVMAYTSFWQIRLHWRSSFALIIPSTASLMYIISLTHWAISLRSFSSFAQLAASTVGVDGSESQQLANNSALSIALLTLLSINAVLSDCIVMWRMCVVWNRARPVCALGAILLAVILGLDLANITSIARRNVQNDPLAESLDKGQPGTGSLVPLDAFAVYDGNSIGLAAAFVSLASNVCATVLVGVKAWLHRRQFTRHLRSDAGRTFVERVMELLVESGVVYTAIWLLYCITFFRPTMGRTLGGGAFAVNAASHLDAAMAQITSIYPLTVFILVALDKIHHSRGPRTLRHEELPKERDCAVTFTFEVDVERSTAQSPGSAHPMVALQCTSDDPPTKDETKLPDPVEL